MKLIPITKLVNHEVAYLIMELWEAIDKLNKRLDTLADDNQQLMSQISAKAEPEITFSYGDTLSRIATALEAIAEAVKPILITKEIQ
jgi:hypothetical protein